MIGPTCRRRELESLVGLLQHAAKVVYPGRSFLHRMIVLLQSTRRASRVIRLNRGFKADLCWWKLLVNNWNGVSFLPMAQPSSMLVSDALGSWGCVVSAGVASSFSIGRHHGEGIDPYCGCCDGMG